MKFFSGEPGIFLQCKRRTFQLLAPGQNASDTLAPEIQDFVKTRTAPYNNTLVK